MENDISSPLTELLRFLLTTIFNLQDEEEEEELELMKSDENKGNITDVLKRPKGRYNGCVKLMHDN